MFVHLLSDDQPYNDIWYRVPSTKRPPSDKLGALHYYSIIKGFQRQRALVSIVHIRGLLVSTMFTWKTFKRGFQGKCRIQFIHGGRRGHVRVCCIYIYLWGHFPITPICVLDMRPWRGVLDTALHQLSQTTCDIWVIFSVYFGFFHSTNKCI
jgi:hypothetical protein